MKFSIETPEEFNTLTKIIKRTYNLDKIMMNFEFNIDINEETLEPKVEDERVHERKEDISIEEYKNRVLEEVKLLQIGGRFTFGMYKGAPIEWIKVSKYRAISAYILDNMAFGDNNNYATSKVREWCNDLGAEYGIDNDGIYIPTEKEIIRWFPNEEQRKCDYSEQAKARGIDDGLPSYWTRTQASSPWYANARVATSSGLFDACTTDYSRIGVRPVLKIEV